VAFKDPRDVDESCSLSEMTSEGVDADPAVGEDPKGEDDRKADIGEPG
jgi:hypothetical protein